MINFALPQCFVWMKPDALVADGGQVDAPLRSDVFLMEFQVRDGVVNWRQDGRPRRLIDETEVGRLRKREFVVGRDELLRDPNLGFQLLCDMLRLAGVPSVFHAPFALQIYLRASTFAYDAANVGRRAIPVVVVVDILSMYEEDEVDEIIAEVVSSSLADDMDGMVPATKASIEALENVETKNVDDKCMICLEELSLGKSEVRKMPCSHLYHGDCIVQWLESSHICPLCRFEMPTDSN